MVSNRLLLAAIVLAGFGTACTALVLGKVSDTEDYKVVPTGTTSGGSSLDDCSLLKGSYYTTDHDANACSTCIQTSCAADVAYACNAGKTEKPWFGKLKTCAQNPWNGFAPPSEGSGSNSYGCKTFQTPVDPVSDKGSDTERDPQAHNCVTTNCMQGALPPCVQCEVSIKKSASEQTESLLRNDPCGSCLVEKCQPSLVKCCATRPMQDFVQHCAFTPLPANKAACLELGKTVPDSGEEGRYGYGDAGIDCLAEIGACFKANCLARCQ